MYSLFSNVKSDREFSATTGLSKVEFYELVYEFEEEEAQLKAERLATAGRKEVLTDGAERLFLVLYYMKNYPSFDVLGLSFGIDATTAERYVVELLPILAKTLRKLKCLPARKAQEIARLEELLGQTDKLLIDATERPVERPQDQDEQKGKYSGKKNAIR
jgi:hypothetical protein